MVSPVVLHQFLCPYHSPAGTSTFCKRQHCMVSQQQSSLVPQYSGIIYGWLSHVNMGSLCLCFSEYVAPSVGSLNVWLQKSLVGALVSNWKLG